LAVFTILGFRRFFCVLRFIKVKLFVKVKLLFYYYVYVQFCLQRPSPRWPILCHYTVLTHSLRWRGYTWCVKNTVPVWTLITLRCLVIERCAICQNFVA